MDGKHPLGWMIDGTPRRAEQRVPFGKKWDWF
jgi:hypothetical protein